MGENLSSQIQDVVVAGSQSSNFLLPKENIHKALESRGHTMVAYVLFGLLHKALGGYC
uniref:Uncharacterized protein n=1 Tax=Anguilla anguilla TaxID=7936 RepID=A0A0E9PZP6_ANGAN